MNHAHVDAQVKAIQQPDRVVEFLDGSVRVAVELLGTVAVGHGTDRPGWRWSLHVAPMTGRASGHHVGDVLSGHMVVRSRAGLEIEVGPNQAFAAEPGHDAWVLGDEPCVALDWWPISDPSS
ncbi:cupin domain-containing protein [Mycobacterium lacus]|uniref:hypothetical protein n=1 Tax=Mycobacterium lacus TaxID=169765 RepID=UPI000A161D1F|nr:hypothetical protein [Mycobacterium lacus]MCV7125947.1 hypothetical protein [Mycobacterium lacus]ORW04645.1 hypothetical protein AWC15_03130 [Mycobacterium lacus]